MEKLEKLCIEMTNEMAMVYDDYLFFYIKLVKKLETVPNMYNLNLEDEDELVDIVKNLKIKFNIMKPVLDYIVEKSDQALYLIKTQADTLNQIHYLHLNTTKDMEWMQ